MAGSYEISFAVKDEYIILPESSVYTIVDAIQKEHSAKVKMSIERLLPPEYVSYAVNIVNANREHSMFHYHYIHKGSIGSEDILEILRRQIGLLVIHGVRCFTKASVQLSGGRVYYKLTINPDIRAYIKDTNREISIREYNRSEEDE